MLDAIVEILRDVLPSRESPQHIWLSRMATLVLIGACVFAIFRDTEAGYRMGLRPAESLTVIDFVESQKTIRDSMFWLNAENGAIDSSFLFLAFDRRNKSLTYLKSADSLPLVSWVSPGLHSSRTIDDIMSSRLGEYQRRFGGEHGECLVSPIPENDRRKLIHAIAGHDSDRIAICPVHSGDRTFGLLTVLWTSPQQNPTALDKTIAQWGQSYGVSIGKFVRSQPKLEIKE